MKVLKKLNLNEVKNFIDQQSPQTKIYLGCDSERFKLNDEWYADYTIVICVHIDGRHGCKIFGEVTREKDYDQRKDRPSMRLMNEVYKVAEVFAKLKEVIVDRAMEVHLDINPNKVHGSSCVIQQAVGYIRGTCNVIPFVKPDAFAASFAADRGISLLQEMGE
jgi:predicted RNase H-related nuclease YkuK (DUF458 family)